jgi:hypothetical protein
MGRSISHGGGKTRRSYWKLCPRYSVLIHNEFLISEEKDSRAGRVLAKCGRGSKRKSARRLCPGATAAAAARLRPKSEEGSGTGRRGHCRPVRQIQVCLSGGHQIRPAAAQNRRHHDPVHRGVRDVVGNLVCSRVCFSVVYSRVRALAGGQTLRFEGERAHVHPLHRRGHPAEGSAAQCLG